ncbi:MAG: MarR family winged helix-turn-helix transcriptional regulator [Acidimicrobiales bacterium]
MTASQSSALARIEQSGPLRLGVLAQVEGVSAATMSKVVDGLEESGLIVRGPDVEDGRASVVQLSEGGEALIEDRRASSTQALASAIGSLPIDDRACLTGALPVLERLADLITMSDPA